MASEILRRNPTSTGNRRVFTWAGWVKINKLSALANCIWYAASAGNSEFNISLVSSTGALNVYDYAPSAYQYQYVTSRLLRDFSNWFHLVVAVDTTQVREDDRFKIYINGSLYNGFYSTETTAGGINHQTRMNTPGEINYIGQNVSGGANYDANCELADMFMIDGQALTPDVFGFYKQGKGYISVGSTQSTDFRPGQWVPKTPRVIKTEINRRGGFGVNGFYLPMNDSNNFGADFHCDPNSIITLNEKLPQPRVGVASTAVGIGYTDALRADPYAANLVLALPFVSGGLSSGFGDYSAAIKGSGTSKSITVTGTVSIASTASYYGSAALFNATSVTENNLLTVNNAVCDFGTSDFTVEFWGYPFVVDTGNNNYVIETIGLGGTRFAILRQGDGAQSGQYTLVMGTNAYDITSTNYGINQWHHLAVCRKNGLVTAYLNGVATYTNTITTDITAQSGAYIGAVPNSSVIYEYQGYLQDLRIYKGVAKYTGGFDVPRPYTPVGIATWRAVPDTTANNFCTWNPLYPGWTGSAVENAEFTNGNLTVSESSANISQGSATIGVSTGKWYYEAIPSLITSANSNLIGIRPAEWFTFNQQNRTSWRNGGAVYDDAGGTAQSGTTYTTTDIIGIAFDMNNRRLWFSKNGSWVYSGDPNNNLNPAVSFASTYTHYTPFFAFDNVGGTESWTANFGQNPTFSGNTTAGTFTDSNGKGLFKYQPPSGFLALCEDNLPTPAISNPGQYFRSVLYRGSGASRNLVGIGFTPDLVWIKGRDVQTNNHVLFDSVRGAATGGYLMSAQTNAEISNSTMVLSFDNDGFSLGSDNTSAVNNSSINYVAWCWRAGAGTTSTNTNGSITSVVSVNQDAGFSIVSYTGNGSNPTTVGHGLTKAPKFIIFKCRNAAVNWFVYHGSMGPSGIFEGLNTTSAYSPSAAAVFNNTAPSSSVITLGGVDSNTNGRTYIAYCWAEIEGFSKFGSYVGNGNADGPFVYCGFKPAWVMIKRSDSTGNWCIHDSSRGPVNVMNEQLQANLSNVESGTGGLIDFLSNGFKIRATSTDLNASNGTYIFAAFAESPFTTANAK